MDECYYLYAITWADAAPQELGAGVDPRFAVEIVPCGQVAGVSSRVGLDQFQPDKLQAGTTDLAHLSEVALRHNNIVDRLAGCWTVLPLRLGTIFQSRDSLVASLTRCEAEAVAFLQRLTDRREWAVKVYLAASPPELLQVSSVGQTAAESLSASPGMDYLAARRRQNDRHQQVQAAVRRELLVLEQELPPCADRWRTLRVLPETLTGRGEKMVFNSAFLVSRAAEGAFHRACDQLRLSLGSKGLIVEVTGPWPPYHFCPSLAK